ncbi:hypothetical protein [Brevibacterium sp. CT2-23B]|uniref:hypothetical protein n=1 Tax=Brevibacterium sp. CT2-23B TaxID=2729630 RepID=UPI0015542805|nr:hypothetical protein [Brevibacterium sp. CT2-23B]
MLEEIDAAQTRIENARAILVDGQETLGTKLDEADTALASLRDSLDNLDSTTLPALRQDLDAAEGRLDSAEGQITDAFGQLDAVPGQISDARQAAIDAAAADAQAKANAARSAAEAAAAQDALSKANAARNAAIASASSDAQAKAEAARQAAETAAKADAKAKADAAQAAAIAAAALDATQKANSAQSAAEAKAATAQQQADLANDKAQALIEAGPNIIVNGDFENPSPNIWPNTTYQTGISVVSADHARSGAHVMRADSTTGNRYPLTDWRDSAAGRIYYAEVWCYHNDTDMTLRGRVSFYAQAQLKDGSTPGFYGADLDGKAVYIYQDQMTPGQWNKIAAYITTPADTLRMRVAPHVLRNETPYDFDDFKVIDVTEAVGALREARAAQARADAAHTAAGSAQAAADAAMSAANGLAKVLHGTTVATGTAPNGSIWWQHQGTLSGPVIGQWNRVNGSWVSTPISSEAIANLDVGKLTAGAAELATVVSQKIAAAVGRFLELDVGQLTVTGASKLVSVVAEQIAADVGEYVKLSVGQLVAGEGVMDEAVIQKLFTDVVVAGISQAEEFIGENALLTNSVTARKIVASEELWAKLGQFVKIRAEHIESDALDFMVARGGTYLTSGGNGSWSDNGLFISGPDGTSLVRFPTDGTPLSLTASDVQIDRASIGELDTTQQTVRSGGTVTLASGVTAPASPPELTAAWQRDVVLNAPNPGLAYDWTGLARWGDKWVRGVNVLTTAGDDLDAIELYNPDGTLNKTIKIDLNPRAGVTVIGDIVYTIGPDHVARPGAERQWCHGFNLNTGARVSRWEFTRFTASGQKQFAVGTDGTNLLTAGVTPTPNLYVMKYNPATGAQIGGTPNPPSTGGDLIDFGWDLPARDLFGVRQSGNDLFVSHVGGTRIYTVSGTTITRKPDTNNSDGLAGFAHENRSCAGVAWVSGIPLVVDPQGRILEGSKFGSDASIQACVTWVNGSQETTASPQATLNVPARATLSVSLPKRAGLQKNLYLKSSQYGGGWVKVTIPETTTSVVLDEVLAGLGQLPAQNTFPASTPAVLKSGNGGFEARGDGSGKWGPLTFGADGSMTGIRKTASGTLDITPIAANTPREVWVTFPVGRFTTPPTVVVSARSTVPGTRVTGVGSGGQTAAGFNAYLTRTDTTTTGFNWIAIEEG